jgi:hypothetical protein
VSKPNLENDLLQCDWIIAKAKANKSYAQNIYAALCNMEWQKREMWPILKEETWGCSWRYAGGLVARLVEEGDYMDWYCSGICDVIGEGFSQGFSESPGECDNKDYLRFVPEGVVSDEIEEDFLKLGWVDVPYKNEVD